MTKRVQILGHIAEVAKSFLGLEREVTADTDNGELRLHDGVNEGGFKFLNRDQNDNRYQGRSVELDGLIGWEPNERGFTARLGPSDYRLRSFEVNGEQLVIENANGYDGNPLLGIAETITTDHTFTGSVTFGSAIQAEGGVVGDVTGNTAGVHTGDVVGNVTGNLTGDAEGNHTGSFEGNANFDGFGVNFADQQLLLPWLEQAIIDFIVTSGVPPLTVVAFAGDIGDIPTNWDICDGTNGTPDLRGRFIIGVSPDYVANATGGSETHAHLNTLDPSGGHSHDLTIDDHALTAAELPAHSHFIAANVIDSAVLTNANQVARETAAGGDTEYRLKGTGTAATIGPSSEVGSGDGHSHSASVGSDGAHTHDGETEETSTLPPYYALIYIMKRVPLG